MITDSIYTRLSTDSTLSTLVGSRIYPTTPDENTTLPFLVYSLSSSEPQLTTDSASTVTKFAVDIDVYDRTQSSVAIILAQLTTLLQGWRGGNVQGSFRQTESIDAISPPDGDPVYQGSHTYSVWDTSVSIVSSPDSTGGISTGPGTVTLTASGHTLTVGPGGVLVDGGPVGGGAGTGPDLTPYARLDSGNSFHGLQTIFGDGDGAIWMYAPDPDSTTGIAFGDFDNGMGAYLNYNAGTQTLDLQGNVTLNGAGVVAGSLLAYYGRTDSANTWSQQQTLTGGIGANLKINNTTTTDPVVQWTPRTDNTGIKFKSGSNTVAQFRDDGQLVVGRLPSSSGGSTVQFTAQDGNSFSFNPSRDFGVVSLQGNHDGGMWWLSSDKSGTNPRDIKTITRSFYVQGANYNGVPSATTLVVQGITSQTGDLVQHQDSSGTVLSRVKKDGSIQPASLSDSAATNNSMYYSTTQNKMCYKDSSGTVHTMY